MSSPHRIRHDLYRATGRIDDPGSGGLIHVDKDGGVCSVDTTDGGNRTLRQPTKVGIVCAVVLGVDGGDLTLTVEGGYNSDGDTDIVFGGEGSYFRFFSIEYGGSYYWRSVCQGGASVSPSSGFSWLSDYDDFADAISTIGANGRLLIDVNETLAETTYTVPEGLSLFGDGGVLTLQAGTTLTINGKIHTDFQLFDNTAGGTVTINGQDVRPSWFGTAGTVAAVNTAAAAMGSSISEAVGHRVPITPEMFGCDPTGVTDCTTELQAFFDFFQDIDNARNYNGVGMGCYRVSSTIEVGRTNMEEFDISIGRTELDRPNAWRTPYPPGIMYDGIDGDGPDPNDCMPIVRLMHVFRGRLSLSVHQDKYGGGDFDNPLDPPNYTTGILFSTNSHRQTGHLICEFIQVTHCFRGVVIGLNDYPGGLVGNTETAREDVFEANTINRMRITGCPFPWYQSSPTSDGTVINSLLIGGHRPVTGRDPDYGHICNHLIHIDQGGTMFLNYVQLSNQWMGLRHIQVPPSGINATTDTITYASHGFSDGDAVHIAIRSPVVRGLDRSRLWYIVNSTTDTFQISKTLGGSANDIEGVPLFDILIAELSGDEWQIYTAGVRVEINKLHCETPMAGIFKTTGGAYGRGPSHIDNLTSANNNYTKDGYAIETNQHLCVTNSGLFGSVRYSNRLCLSNVNFGGFEDRDYPPLFSTATAHPEVSLLNVTTTPGNTGTPEIKEAGSILFKPHLYGKGTETWYSDDNRILYGKYRTFIDTDVNTTDDKIEISNPFVENMGMVFRTTGTLPAPLETLTRYFVLNQSGSEFQLKDADGNTIVLTDGGVGTHTAHQAIDVCEYRIDTGAAFAVRIVLKGIAKRPSTPAGVISFDVNAVMMREADGTIGKNVSVNTLVAETEVVDFDLLACVTYDTGTNAFRVSLTAVNNYDGGLSCVMNAEIYGMRHIWAMYPTHEFLGYNDAQLTQGFSWLPVIVEANISQKPWSSDDNDTVTFTATVT